MADMWQTIEQAAVTLGLSVRTVNRHITAGKLQSRLFEGRREVLVNEAPFAVVTPASTATSPHQNSPNFTFSPTNPHDRRTARPNASIMEETGRVREVGLAEPLEPNPDASDTWEQDKGNYSNVRQRVTPEVAAERPMDLQTMLALTDSIDDKATLAVAAYQTLARSAETQVQSLRKIAYGAWGVVGLMAAGVTVAVGWAAIRLTSAETSATYLKDQLDKSNAQIAKFDSNREELLNRIQSEQAAERSKVEAERAKLDATSREINERWGLLQAETLRQSQMGRQGGTYNTTMFPPVGSDRALMPVGSPTTAPAFSPRPSPTTSGSSTSRPSTSPTGRPNPSPSSGSPSAPNPGSAFGPK